MLNENSISKDAKIDDLAIDEIESNDLSHNPINSDVQYSDSVKSNSQLYDSVKSNSQLSTSNIQSLSDLNDLIDSSSNKISLSSDYKYISWDSKSGILIDKDLEINGNGFTIDGANSARIFNITESSTLILRNLNIINANSDYCGGAIYSLGSLIANDVNFTNNNVLDGDYVHYYGEYGSYDGGAIYSNGSSSFINCNFIKNMAESGGAVYLNGASSFLNCSFINNTASGGLDYDLSCYGENYYVGAEGAAIYTSADVSIRDSNFTDNYANLKEAKGPGIIYLNAHNEIDNCNFNLNNADAVIYWHGNGSISNSSFMDNSGYDCGGAIFLAGNASIADCDFISNYGANYGGAIYSVGCYDYNQNTGESAYYDSEISIDHCNFIYNYAYFDGGAIYIIANTSVKNSYFGENWVDVEGFKEVNEYYYYFDLTNAGNGGAIYMENGTLSNCTFIENNAALNGGAVYANGTAMIADSRFSLNTAILNGDNIYNNENISLSANRIDADYATIYNDNYWSTSLIESPVSLVLLENKTYYYNSLENFKIYARLMDDNGNLIEDSNVYLNFNDMIVLMSFNNESSLYEYTLNSFSGDELLLSGEYDGSSQLTVKTSIIKLGVVSTALNYTLDFDGSDIIFAIDLTASDDSKLNETVELAVNCDDSGYLLNESILLKDGQGSVRLSDILPGDYNFSLIFAGNENYDPSSLYGKFSISKIDAALAIEVNEISSDSARVKINLDKCNGLVDVFVSGMDAQSIELIEGEAQINLSSLASGNYTVIAIFNGTSLYDPVWNFTSFEIIRKDPVKTLLEISVSDFIYGEDAAVNFSLTDQYSNPLNESIFVQVSGQTYNLTLKDGKARLSLKNLSADTYAVFAIFRANDDYLSSFDFKTFKVSRLATFIEYSDMETITVDSVTDGRVGEYFNITLKDSNDKLLANKTVYFGFNGKVYNKTTDSNGFACLQINLPREDLFTFALCFLGDENYSASFFVAKINVVKQVPNLTTAKKTYKASAKTKTLTATLKSLNGNPIKNRIITFTVNGKSYTAKTNSNGIASVKVSLSTKKTYSFTVKYAGDKYYAPVSSSAKLVIN